MDPASVPSRLIPWLGPGTTASQEGHAWGSGGWRMGWGPGVCQGLLAEGTCLTAPLSEACFLADADKEPGSSSSSDAEEDPLPANKCKKVSNSDTGVDSSLSAVALVLSGGSPTPSTPP